MTRLALIRHAPTAWNRDKRLQGRADIALSEESRARLARQRPPRDLHDARWHASPLARARQTTCLPPGVFQLVGWIV